MTDPALSPDHYRTRFGFECIELTQHMTFQAGNAAKYVYRHGEKENPLRDMGKSRVYWDWVIASNDPVILPGDIRHHTEVERIYREFIAPIESHDPTARILGLMIKRRSIAALIAIRNRIDFIESNGGAV